MGKMILMNFDKVTKGASAPFSFEASFDAHRDTRCALIAERHRE
jgi:hypothetical protein